MKYVLNIEFRNLPKCSLCMLCRSKGFDLNHETVMGCAALGTMPKCPDEGYRKDCPLKPIEQ